MTTPAGSAPAPGKKLNRIGLEVVQYRGRTFESQTLWKRIVIVLAGPAMNVLFPVALYTSVFLEDAELLPPTVGTVKRSVRAPLASTPAIAMVPLNCPGRYRWPSDGE